jgi:hypothetical protein
MRGQTLIANRDMICLMDDKALFEAYARLNSLKTNVPNGFEVHEKWVEEFHTVLDLLETSTGHYLRNFRIPSPEIKPTVIAARMGTARRPGSATYSKDNYCERSFLVMKIDGVLNYFSYQSAPQERRIGFQPPAE